MFFFPKLGVCNPNFGQRTACFFHYNLNSENIPKNSSSAKHRLYQLRIYGISIDQKKYIF